MSYNKLVIVAGHWYVETKPILLLGTMLFLLASAVSAEWTVTPSTAVGGTYNTNFNTTTENTDGLYRTTFTAGLDSAVNTDRWNTDFGGSYNGTRTIGQPELDQDTGGVNFLSSYLTENSTWGLNGSVGITEPNSSELETGNQEFDIVTVLNWNVGPSWEWTINEQNSLGLSYNYSSVAYSDTDDSGVEPGATNDNFADFFSHSASTQLGHQYTESIQLTVGLSFTETENESDTQRSKTDQFSLQLGGNYSYSDTVSMSLSAGGIYLISKRRTGETEKSTSISYVVSASANKTFDYGALSAAFSHNFSPTLNGGLTETNSLAASYNRQLSETLSGSIGISVSESEQIQATVSATGRRTISTNLGLSWQFYENWSLNGGYSFQWLDQDGGGDGDGGGNGNGDETISGGASTSHTVSVNLSYNWAPFTILP